MRATIFSLAFFCSHLNLFVHLVSGHLNGGNRPTLFNFDQSMVPGMGDIVFLDQISIQLAIPRPDPNNRQERTTNASALISGRNGSLLEVLPEIGYFRDIVFYFKHAVSGKATFDPKHGKANWMPSHATLHWSTAPISTENVSHKFVVSAFLGYKQEFVEIATAVEEKKKSKFQYFVSLFNAKTEIERQRLSSADPTTVVNSLSEKLSKSK